MLHLLGPDEPPPDYQDLALNRRSRQEVQGAVGYGDGTSHSPGDPERSAVERQPSLEPAARRKRHVALHSGGGGIVVEGDQLGDDLGRGPREPPSRSAGHWDR